MGTWFCFLLVNGRTAVTMHARVTENETEVLVCRTEEGEEGVRKFH